MKPPGTFVRSEEHTSELQSHLNLVCRLLLEKKNSYKAALRQLIEKTKPRYVVFPHTYQVRDFAPKLATSLGRVLVSDAVSHHVHRSALVFGRHLFQGKMNVVVRF